MHARGANRTGAIAGAVVGLVLRIGGGEPLLNLPAFISYGFPSPSGSDFPFRTFAMLASLLTIWFASSATRLRDPPRPLAECTRADSSRHED